MRTESSLGGGLHATILQLKRANLCNPCDEEDERKFVVGEAICNEVNQSLIIRRLLPLLACKEYRSEGKDRRDPSVVKTLSISSILELP